MQFYDSIHETQVVGRELSGKSFSGKNIDYKIPEMHETESSLSTVKSALMDSMQDLDDIAILLSGGKDSRLLAVLLKDLGKKPVCYTYISGDTKYDRNELSVAQTVSKLLGFEHKTIEIDWKKFYDRKIIPKIIKKSDGVPLFHTLLTMAHVRDKIPEKVLITGDLVTELIDTAEYRPWKDGNNWRKVLFNRERIIVSNNEDRNVIEKLKNMYNEKTLNEMLLLRKSDRLVRRNLYKELGWNVFHPALDRNVLSNVFSLPISERTDGKIPRRIIREVNPVLYKTRTARSPFSLRYPLSFHIAYAKVMNSNVDSKREEIHGYFDDDNVYIVNRNERYRNDNYLWWKSIYGDKE